MTNTTIEATTPELNPLVATLTKARDLIAQGWTQGVEFAVKDGKACYCADGALLTAAGGKPDVDTGCVDLDPVVFDLYEEANQTTKDAVQTVAPESKPWHSHVTYNDANGRTQEEMVALFDTAIEIAKEKTK